MDINLAGNKLRYRFIDSPIIDGISVQETQENVIILVPTVCSVHRLRFPHPSLFHKQVKRDMQMFFFFIFIVFLYF